MACVLVTCPRDQSSVVRTLCGAVGVVGLALVWRPDTVAAERAGGSGRCFFWAGAVCLVGLSCVGARGCCVSGVHRQSSVCSPHCIWQHNLYLWQQYVGSRQRMCTIWQALCYILALVGVYLAGFVLHASTDWCMALPLCVPVVHGYDFLYLICVSGDTCLCLSRCIRDPVRGA